MGVSFIVGYATLKADNQNNTKNIEVITKDVAALKDDLDGTKTEVKVDKANYQNITIQMNRFEGKLDKMTDLIIDLGRGD